MRKIILFSVIQQLLYHISRVESLIGQNFTAISGGEFPFIASFQYFPGEFNFCGGALITEKHVITAAYCVENVSRENFRIVFEVAHAQAPALTYTAASWTTYDAWVRRQLVMPHGRPRMHGDVAIVTLTDRVYNVNPVPLNRLTKRQLVEKEAIMTGWKNDVLSKATVELLSDEDCLRSIRVLRNNLAVPSDVLCSAANPLALLYNGDMGSPLLYARDNSLLGIAYGFCPGDVHVHGNFSIEFIREHQVNVHTSVDYYGLFIHSVVPAAPAA